MEYDELKRLMTESGSLTVGKGASEFEIQEAQQALGLPIRGDYRKFLLDVGWGGVGCFELYGLGSDVPPFLNLIAITHSERTEMSPPLRQELIPVMNDGGGNLYCLDSASEGPQVVFWDHEGGGAQVPAVEAEDFSSWFAGLINTIE
ncbi:MAG: SMI1/KNR4 family protein [Byssovorax sp.]